MKKIATNTTNSIRTHATGVRFSSYQFVVFFIPEIIKSLEVFDYPFATPSGMSFTTFLAIPS